MKLTDGTTMLTITIEGYEFPEIEDQKWDSNWLMVRVVAVGPGDPWAQVDPGLLTWEVEALANWLEAIASSSARVPPEQRFLEPFLRFRLIDGDERRLEVSAGYGRLRMAVAVVPDELRSCAESLLRQLAEFPRRG